MEIIDRYEVIAEAFRIMTGHMAPGKDASPATYPAPFEERSEAWEQWNKDNKKLIRAMILSFDHIILNED